VGRRAPNLYTLQASVTDGANVVETVSRTFGFRQIQRDGGVYW